MYIVVLYHGIEINVTEWMNEWMRFAMQISGDIGDIGWNIETPWTILADMAPSKIRQLYDISLMRFIYYIPGAIKQVSTTILS
jgi:hypothetical protein